MDKIEIDAAKGTLTVTGDADAHEIIVRTMKSRQICWGSEYWAAFCSAQARCSEDARREEARKKVWTEGPNPQSPHLPSLWPNDCRPRGSIPGTYGILLNYVIPSLHYYPKYWALCMNLISRNRYLHSDFEIFNYISLDFFFFSQN